MKLVAFVNPRARSNRRDPTLLGRLRDALGDAGRLLAPNGLDALEAEIRALPDQAPDVVAVHGGDGTLHRVLTSILRTWPTGRALPAFAILPGGTMNVVSSSLRLRQDPVTFLEGLRRCVREGRPVETVSRNCLSIGEHYGFVFANGGIARFLERYYETPSAYGPARALWICIRLIASTPFQGPFVRDVGRPYRGRTLIDGQELPWRALTSVSAATVREVGMGFKLNHRADEDPSRMAVLAIHTGPVGIIMDAPSIFQGEGLSPERATSYLAREILLEPDELPMPYTIDGDIYRESGPLRLAMGPLISFVKPPTF